MRFLFAETSQAKNQIMILKWKKKKDHFIKNWLA